MVVLTCKKEMYRIPGIPADDYPVVADQEELPMNKIKGSMLREMIRKTAFAMSADEMRKNLNGVFLETEHSGGNLLIRMVATDGHRLAMMKMDIGEEDFLIMEKGVIIPRKGLGEIRRLVEDVPGDVFIGIRQGMCIDKNRSCPSESQPGRWGVSGL